MARRESQAVAGFFPTPPRVVEILCKAFTAGTQDIVIVDPCAGEGDAVAALRKSIRASAKAHTHIKMLLVEMETTRHATLSKLKSWSDKAALGDFFHLKSQPRCANLLWLNPPYDTDREYGRLEERFLQRAQHLLVPDGLMVFIIPGYALSASAVTLATGFSDLQCWRFPNPEYAAYRQVVLIARRKSDNMLDTATEAMVRDWAREPDSLPVFPSEPDFVFPIRGFCNDSGGWNIIGFDTSALTSFHPWVGPRGPIPNICPPDNLAAQFQRTYPVASVPRAAHLSAALAAGVFNGTRVVPNDPTSKLPPILVKGVFDKDYRTLEERTDKDGNVTSRLEVQQPKLSVAVLDLHSGSFHTVLPSSTLTATSTLENMTLGDLLDSYGVSLMREMLKACPVLHDGRRGDPEPDIGGVARPLYPAQTSAVHTAIKLYNQRDNQGVILLGEIGSGKTSVALATAIATDRKRILVVCPPHLLDGWRDQAAIVAPQYKCMVLDTILDVQRFMSATEPTIAVLSRERAKLGHAWRSVVGACPKCGTALPSRDFSIRRETCVGESVHPTDPFSAWVARHAVTLARYIPEHPAVRTFLRDTPYTRRLLKKMSANRVADITPLRPILDEIAIMPRLPFDVAAWLAWLVPEHALALAHKHLDGIGSTPDTARQGILLALDSGVDFERWTFKNTWESTPWDVWDKHHALVLGEPVKVNSYQWGDWGPETYKGVKRRSILALSRLVDALCVGETQRRTCGERLYQAIPEPRRYPLATWISHNARNAYDFLILDEAHELAGEGSAQAHAAQRLLHGKAQTMLLTGSLANGYADSVFGSMYAVSPMFRTAFGRGDRSRFIDRYGYWKRIVQEKDQKGNVVAFGSCTDRVQQSMRKAGVAPGIMPLFLLEHLLPVSVTLQKEDLRIGIPPSSNDLENVGMLPEQASSYTYLLSKLLEEIKKTKFKPGLAGKLWGALAHLPSYLDRACCGDYVIRWPEGVPDIGGQVICSVPSIDPSIILPKEQRMLDLLHDELAKDRNVMVFGWHVDVLSRLVQIIRAAGVDAECLEADRVPTGKRQAWIDTRIVKPNKRVLVVNPVTIQTGLNNLVHFHTSMWMENPGCNPIIYRQAEGRTDRIGQTLPTWFWFPVYEGSAQEQLHRLLLHKVGVSRSVDGLDPEAALRSAGVLDESFAGLSVGRELYRMLTGN